MFFHSPVHYTIETISRQEVGHSFFAVKGRHLPPGSDENRGKIYLSDPCFLQETGAGFHGAAGSINIVHQKDTAQSMRPIGQGKCLSKVFKAF